jgi:hypothetical protein
MTNLTYQNKRIILIIGMLVVGYIAYQLSFKYVVSAFWLNSDLQNEKANITNLDSSFPQVSSTNTFYLTVLKGYSVKQEDRENELWQSISGMALNNSVKISFVPNAIAPTDTTALLKNIVQQQFTFKGNYFNLVKLLDTISRSREIGKIADLKIFTKRDALDSDGSGQLTINLTMIGVVR